MSARQDRQQHLAHDLLLAENDFVDFVQNYFRLSHFFFLFFPINPAMPAPSTTTAPMTI